MLQASWLQWLLPAWYSLTFVLRFLIMWNSLFWCQTSPHQTLVMSVIFWLHPWHVGSQFPGASDLSHLQWKCGILTTGLPGKSLECPFWNAVGVPQTVHTPYPHHPGSTCDQTSFLPPVRSHFSQRDPKLHISLTPSNDFWLQRLKS